MKTYKQEGQVINYTTVGAVVSGAVVAIGRWLGIVVNDIAALGTGPLRIRGVCTVTKDGTYAWTQGQDIYYDAANTRFTSANTGVHAGIAAAAAGASATSGDLHLNEGWDTGVYGAIVDPGDAGAIPIVGNGYVPLVSAAAETRTLAAPTFAGQQILLAFKTDGGDITLTVATGYSESGRTSYVFQNAGEFLLLTAVYDGANLRWRATGGDVGLENLITDPGNAGAIPVTRSGYVPLVSAGAETRTLAAPSFLGQEIDLQFKTDAGDIVLTVATELDGGRTTYRFQTAGEHLKLTAVAVGANLRWRITGGDLNVANVIPDPGTGAAIPVERSGTVAITTAGAETNTLAIPTFKGQRLSLIDDTHVGNRVVTSAQAINQAGNTVMTFGAAADFIELVATTVGGALRWRVAANDGVALS